jgi:hypothetical protein
MLVGNADAETQTHLDSIPFLRHCFLLGVLFVLLGLFKFLHVQELYSTLLASLKHPYLL